MKQVSLINALIYYQLAASKNQLHLAWTALKSPKNFAVAFFSLVILLALPYWAAHIETKATFIVSILEKLTPHYVVASVVALEVVCRLLFNCKLGCFAKGLMFTPAEISFLFATPLSRRQIILFKLLSLQCLAFLGVLASAVVGPIVFSELSFLRLLIGWLVSLNLLALLYFLLRYFISSMVLLNRTYISQLGLIALACVILVTLIQTFMQASMLTGDFSKFNTTPAFARLRYPLDVLFAAALSHSWFEFFRGIWLPVLVLLGAYGVFFTRKFPIELFEELLIGSQSLGNKKTKAPTIKTSAKSLSEFSTSWPLAPMGPQWKAIAWKSAMANSFFSRKLVNVFLIISLLLVPAITLLPQAYHYIISTLAITTIASLLLVGPWVIKMGVRQSMMYMDLLKSMPLKGRQLLYGEMVVPLAISSALVLFALACLIMIAFVHPISFAWMDLDPFTLFGAFPMLISMLFARFTVHNLFAIYLPSFVSFSQNNNSSLYQLFIRGVVSISIFSLLLICPIALIWGSLLYATHHSLLVINGASILLMVEVWLLIHFSDARYRNFDISQENSSS